MAEILGLSGVPGQPLTLLPLSPCHRPHRLEGSMKELLMVCGPTAQTRPNSACTRPREGSLTLTPAMRPWPVPWGRPPGCGTFPHMSLLGHPIQG